MPAKSVGGDLYDFFLRDGRLFFCLGDVAGKGLLGSQPETPCLIPIDSRLRSHMLYEGLQAVNIVHRGLQGERFFVHDTL